MSQHLQRAPVGGEERSELTVLEEGSQCRGGEGVAEEIDDIGVEPAQEHLLRPQLEDLAEEGHQRVDRRSESIQHTGLVSPEMQVEPVVVFGFELDLVGHLPSDPVVARKLIIDGHVPKTRPDLMRDAARSDQKRLSGRGSQPHGRRFPSRHLLASLGIVVQEGQVDVPPLEERAREDLVDLLGQENVDQVHGVCYTRMTILPTLPRSSMKRWASAIRSKGNTSPTTGRMSCSATKPVSCPQTLLSFASSAIR